MQEHPIPQDVTGYRFHIVGNMTLKQFAQVGAGVIVAVIIYNTNLLAIVKWPLIIFFVGLGGMMAFVPIEEQPLDHWITTFFKRLYGPTKFYWKRKGDVPFPLTEQKQVVEPTTEPEAEVDLNPARRQRIQDYLKSVQQTETQEDWEAIENNRITEILDTFGNVKVSQVDSKPQSVRPNLTPRVRKLPAEQAPTTDKKEVVFKAEEKVITPKEDPDSRAQTREIEPPLKTTKQSKPDMPAAPVEIFANEEVSVGNA